MTVQALLLAGSANWTFVAAGAVGTGINPVAAIPAGVFAGDLLVIVGGNVNGDGFTTPSGWTAQLLNNQVGLKFSVWTKIYAADTNVTVTNPSDSKVVMVAYRNIKSSYLDVAGTATSNLVTTSLTTTVANDLVMSIYCVDNTGGSWGAPASTTTRVSAIGSARAGLLIVDENKATAGATSSRTATNSASVAGSFALSFKQV